MGYVNVRLLVSSITVETLQKLFLDFSKVQVITTDGEIIYLEEVIGHTAHRDTEYHHRFQTRVERNGKSPVYAEVDLLSVGNKIFTGEIHYEMQMGEYLSV